ncbi:MAG TPA: chain length determinant protein tyrosine kinase EpsG [Burkholderiales bacterium]
MNTIRDDAINDDLAHSARLIDSRRIGAILIDEGKLTIQDAERIIFAQKEKGLRFGEAAVALGLVTDADIQRALSRQHDYPYLLPNESKVSRKLAAAYEPFGKQGEALRALRSQLLLRWFSGEPERRTLAVVSADRGDGRSVLAANLAVAFSQLGENTLLIDADMRHPSQHALFSLDNRVGLSAILSHRGGLEAAEPIAAFQNLYVLPTGAIPPNPQELLSRPNFAQLLEQAAARFEVVLIDTPATNQYADAQTVAVRASGALLVTRKHRTRLRDADGLAQNLVRLSAHMVGAVINEF